MSLKLFSQISRSLRAGILVAGTAGILIGSLAWFQIERERAIDIEDVERRAHLLAHRVFPAVSEALREHSADVAEVLAPYIEGYRRFLGIAVFGADGRLIASAKDVEEFSESLVALLAKVMAGASEASEAARTHGGYVHILMRRLPGSGEPLQGAVAVLHDIGYVDERATVRLVQFAFWTLIMTLTTLTLVVAVTWMAYDRPLKNLADWMRRLRTEDEPESPPTGLPMALLASESQRLATSFRAARSAGHLRTQASVRSDNLWTRDRLRAHTAHCLRGGQLVAVSNREPYMHLWHAGKPRMIMPAGGLVTALDPVLESCGGVWVAHGAGDADHETADADGHIMVPPEDPRYMLRRLWLSRDAEQGYYYGFSNEGLWPLCHLAHERPVFRASDWGAYQRVNQQFADAVSEEIGSGDALVLVQDYHLALVPSLLKRVRPDISVGIFWHIPWPNPESFRICPWRAEVLHGMLGADLVGFHLQQYCNNFLDTVDRMIEARLDWDHFAVETKGHRSLVRPFPISVAAWSERGVPDGEQLRTQIQQIRKQHKLRNDEIIVGVDRIDYTKGLAERFLAVGRFFEKYPEYRRRVTFVQLGAPSRTHLRRYRDLLAELESLADENNWRFQTDDWKPIRFLVAHHNGEAVHAFLSMASICIVSSLQDGMNLVAKEYVAAQSGIDGVLILSEFAGAARELSDALIINPYDTEHFAETLRTAIAMAPEERHARMARMHRQVEERNIYCWAASFVEELGATRTA